MRSNYLDDLTGEADLVLTGELDAGLSRDLLHAWKERVGRTKVKND